LILFHNVQAARVQGYLTLNPIAMIFNQFTPLAAWFIFFSFVLWREELEAAGIQLVEVAVALSLFYAHRMTVALKYAFLSPLEYSTYLNCTHEPTLKRWQSEIQLVGGFMSPNPILRRYELQLAARRIGVSLETLQILIEPANLDLWLRFMPTFKKEVGEFDRSGQTCIPVSAQQFCDAIINRFHPSVLAMFFIIFPFVVFQALLPGVSRMANGQSFGGDTSFSQAVFAAEFFLILTTGTPVAMFLSGGVADMYRIYCVQRLLHGFIRLNKFIFPEVPRLNLKLAQNIRAWLYSSLLLFDWGERYRVRMRYFQGAFAILAVCLMGVLLEQFIVHYDDSDAFRLSMSVHVALYDVFVITCLLLVLVLFGALVNEQRVLCKMDLIFHRLHLRELTMRSQKATPTEELDMHQGAAAETADDLLDAGIQSLEILHETKPVRLMGLRATVALAGSILTLLSPSFVLVISKLLSIDLLGGGG